MSIFLLLSLGISYAFEQRPQNTVVKIGKSFELSCEHDSPQIYWYHRRLLTANDRNHEENVKENNRTKIYKDNNATTLVISAAEVNDAGIYTCLVITDQIKTEQATAVVEVISDPTCEFKGKTTPSETEKIEILCTLSHYGPAKPVMRWKQVAANDEKELSSTDAVIMYSTTTRLNALTDVTMPRSEFRLEASFDLRHLQSSHFQNMANNTLDLHLWKSPDIRIIFLPSTTMEDRTTEALDWPNATQNDNVDTDYMMVKVFLPAFCLSLAIIGGLIVYIISRKRKKRNKETVRVKAILRGRQVAPECSASQQVFPQSITKLQPLDDDDNYLSPRPDLTATATACDDDDNNYEELPDMKSLSVHNIVYFEYPSSKSVPLPSTPDLPSGQRTCNDYMEISECEPNPRAKIYESLRRK